MRTLWVEPPMTFMHDTTITGVLVGDETVPLSNPLTVMKGVVLLVVVVEKEPK